MRSKYFTSDISLEARPQEVSSSLLKKKNNPKILLILVPLSSHSVFFHISLFLVYPGYQRWFLHVDKAFASVEVIWRPCQFIFLMIELWLHCRSKALTFVWHESRQVKVFSKKQFYEWLTCTSKKKKMQTKAMASRILMIWPQWWSLRFWAGCRRVSVLQQMEFALQSLIAVFLVVLFLIDAETSCAVECVEMAALFLSKRLGLFDLSVFF